MKQETVLRLLADGIPRSLPQIKEATGLGKLDSVLADMFSRGKVVASQKVRAYAPTQRGNGDWYWKRSVFRFYTVSNGERQMTKTCQYESFDRKRGETVTISKDLVFTHKSESGTSKRTKTGRLVRNLLAHSATALFAHEIATELGIPASRVRASLNYMTRQGSVRKAGWWSKWVGREAAFHEGYLYFLGEEQYQKRLEKRDVLRGQKRAIYQKVFFNSKVQRRLTPYSEIFPYENREKPTAIQEIQSIYPEFKRVEENGRTYYYIEGELSDLEKQLKDWSERISRRQSFHSQIGRAHEEYAHLALGSAFQRGDLKVERYRWDFRIEKGGRKRFNIYQSRASDPRRVYEFDRVLKADLAPFSNNRYARIICFVFEARYINDPTRDDWDQFVSKLADTHEFGTAMQLPSTEDPRRRIRVRALKPTVIPILIVSWSGRKNIELNARKINLAEYVSMQGGTVIFTGELERYMATVAGRKVPFKKLFREWYSNPEAENCGEFTEYLLRFLGVDAKDPTTGSKPVEKERKQS